MKIDPEKKVGHASRYARSLAWIAGLVATAAIVANLVELLFVDFIHGNPHRTPEDTIETMLFLTPIFGVAALAGVLLVFGLPQVFQGVASRVLSHRLGSKADFALLLILPITAVITWYSYDYLTPSNITFAVHSIPDGIPYQHGLTAARYWEAVAAQAPMTLFTVVYARTAAGALSRNVLLWMTAAAVIFAGVVFGHHLAETQYKFL